MVFYLHPEIQRSGYEEGLQHKRNLKRPARLDHRRGAKAE